MRRLAAFGYGILSYVLFLLVFLYAIGFVGNLLVPKSIDTGEAGPIWTALAVNALLLGIFALQHSGMARPRFKKWWTRLVPESIERSTYVLLASLSLALLFWFWRPLPVVIWSVESEIAQWIMWGLFAFGWGTVLVATFMISHAHLFGLKQVYEHLRGEEQSALDFQTPGLYRHIRHPIMLGFFIAFWATPTMTLGHLVFALATSGYILLALQFEERDLLGRFGDRYEAYRAQVPMFIPGLGRNRSQTESRKQRHA